MSLIRPGRLIGIMGSARVGKDTMAEYLAKHYRVVRIGLADPMKRFCQEIFNFSDEQMWGDERDLPDHRLARAWEIDEHIVQDHLHGIEHRVYGKAHATNFLTPRYALQTLGTEWGRDCYPNVWIDYGVKTAKKLLDDGYAIYSAKEGLVSTEKDVGICPGVAFSDLRFKNEFNAVRGAGGFMVRIYRPGAPKLGGIEGHQSESEQKSLPDADFDYVIHNDGTLEDYWSTIETYLVPKLWP